MYSKALLTCNFSPLVPLISTIFLGFSYAGGYTYNFKYSHYNL